MDRLSALYRQYQIFSPCVRVVADIGADHGYLPMRILSSGFDGRLVVTDIAEQPLALAWRNIGDRPGVEFRRCAGLDGDFLDVDLFFVAGMGGDLIVDIVRSAVRDGAGVRNDARFVLQPMTNFEKVFDAIGAGYLWSYFANEKNKHYRIVVAANRNFKGSDGGKAFFQNLENMEIIRIPFVPDFETSETAESLAAQVQGFELILRENVSDAISFFESRVEQQAKITASAHHSGDALLLEKCAARSAKIHGALKILRESLGQHGQNQAKTIQ